MPGAQASTMNATGRLVFVDRLRVLAIVLVFAYHSARPFDDFEQWHIKHRELSSWFTYPMAVGSQVAMPLFWLLSGVATWMALSRHPPGDFLHRRLARLLLPVVTVGWFVLCPPQVYIESTTGQHYLAPDFSGSFLAFLPAYLSGGFYGAGGWFPIEGLHLWYLFYLTLFTLASMPLFSLLTGERGRRAIARVAGAAGRWWFLPALCAPLLASELLLPPTLPVLGWYLGGWRLGSYWLFLLLGCVLASDPRFLQAVVRHRVRWLALAAVTVVPLLVWPPQLTGLVHGTPLFQFQWSLRTVNGWLCVLAILGYAAASTRPAGRTLALSAELALPFYIIHQTPIVVAAWVVHTWPLPVAVAFPLVAVSALAVTAGACLVIRRVRTLRLLFGMPVSPRGPVRPAALAT